MATVTVVTALLVLAGLHVYWALGGVWPAKDATALVAVVIGRAPGTRMPGPAACVAVALSLAVAAIVLAGARGLIALPVPANFSRWAGYAVVAVLALRGLLGFFATRIQPAISGTPFARLNVLYYSPLCLVLAALSLVALVAPW